MNTSTSSVNQERIVRVFNGWLMLPLTILALPGGIALLCYSIAAGVKFQGQPNWGLFTISLIVLFLGVLAIFGFFTLQPNEARVLILFGAYKGTVRESGFHWGNPFYTNRGTHTSSTHAAESEHSTAASRRGSWNRHK